LTCMMIIGKMQPLNNSVKVDLAIASLK